MYSFNYPQARILKAGPPALCTRSPKPQSAPF